MSTRERIKHYNKKRFIREITRRKRQKQVKCHRKYSHSQYNDNSGQRIATYEKYTTLVAPKVFSIVDNAEETIGFLSEVSKKIDRKLAVRIDLAEVNKITPESILYLLLLVSDAERKKVPFSGNAPKSPSAFSIFINSGFYDYVKSNLNQSDLKKNTNILTVRTGNLVSIDAITAVIAFVKEKITTIDDKNISAIYKILIESITNTNEHAASQEGEKHWWLMALYEVEQNRKIVRFAVIDDGIGIVRTARKTFFEKIVCTDAELLKRLLAGSFARSKTGKKTRGKGIPNMKLCQTKKLIKRLVLVANKGYYDVEADKQIDLSLSFKGSVIAWDFI